MSNVPATFRLVTRSDFDGLVCAVLLKEKENISEILFVHPRDMQEGLISIRPNDISANLPYVEGVYRAFDHHLSETIRVAEKKANHIIDPSAPSAAHVIYNYYGGEKAFPSIQRNIIEAVDKGDTADFTIEEVLHPQNWVMLNFIMDARTGLGRFRNFRISNYQLMMDLTDYCRTHAIEEILNLDDVKERTELYLSHQDDFRQQIQQNATVYDSVLVVDIRPVDIIYAGNRFVKYALYPDCNVSIQALWGYNKKNTVFTVGKSIFNKSSKHSVGEIMLGYGGGGHDAAGTCQIENDQAAKVLQELIDIFRS